MSVNASPAATSCITDGQAFQIYTSYCGTTVLLVLPLCVFVVHQWWAKRSSSSSSSSSSAYSDCFTYHLVAMETLGRLGMLLTWFALYVTEEEGGGLAVPGYCLLLVAWYGEMLFHVLACVERHLAAVHPVAYLRLRGARGVRARNAAAAAARLLSLAGLSFLLSRFVDLLLNVCVIAASLAAVSYCSASVLRVLIRRRPGEEGGGARREGAGRASRRRALVTMVAILAALLVKFLGSVVYSVAALTGSDTCVMLASAWLSVPSRLVLPLLFLNKAAAARRARRARHTLN